MSMTGPDSGPNSGPNSGPTSKRLIDLLEDDFAGRRSELEVLGVKVFVSPMTVGEQMRINALHPDDAALRMAEILVTKCRDAEGNAVFTKDDKARLKRAVAGDRLGPIVAAITGPPVEALGKN